MNEITCFKSVGKAMAAAAEALARHQAVSPGGPIISMAPECAVSPDGVEGLMAFRVPLEFLGLPKNGPRLGRETVINHTFANMLGDWLVRMHLPFLLAVRDEFILDRTAKRRHEQFGMRRVEGGAMVFIFHHELLDRMAKQDAPVQTAGGEPV